MKKVTLVMENGYNLTFDKVISVNYHDKSSEFYFIQSYPKNNLEKSTFHVHQSKVYSFNMTES